MALDENIGTDNRLHITNTLLSTTFLYPDIVRGGWHILPYAYTNRDIISSRIISNYS